MSETATAEVKGTVSNQKPKSGCCGSDHAPEAYTDAGKATKEADRRTQTPSASKGTCCCGTASSKDAR
jgi:hypothetical protein